MGSGLKEKKVGDMTVGELQDLIRKTIHEMLDPDYGLDLRPEIEEELKDSMRQKERGEGLSLEEARKQLGLE
jgi:hypothetical protein